jgi:hypothetical protein
MVFSVDVPLSKKNFVPHVTCNLRNLILVRVSESTSLISTKYFDSALSRDLTIPWDDRARVKIR